MNETLKTLLNRRSIRSYKQEQINQEELQTILEAGKYAPSAMNQQSWHFTVVQNKEIIDKINEVCKVALQRAGNQNFNVFYNAPTVIIVSGDDKAIAPQIDSALALGNMLLAAESLGIGSCWIHAVRALSTSDEGKELIKALKIPEGHSIVGSGAFGYKAVESPSPAPRKEGTVNFI